MDNKKIKKFESFDGKRVRILKDDENSFTIIEPKTGDNIKLYIDKDNISLNNPNIKFETKNTPSKKKSKLSDFFIQPSFNLIEILITIIIVVGLCMIIALYRNDSIVDMQEDISASSLTDDERLNEFINIYKEVINHYYDDLDRDALLDYVTKSMIDYLGDTYTGYLDIYEARNLQDKLNGEYNGFGIEVSARVSDGALVVTNVFPNTPASNVGIMVGDELISVGNINLEGKSSGEVALLIKDKINSKVTLVVKRNGEELSFDIEKSNIIVKSVDYNIFDTTGYIKIDIFSNTTLDQFKEALQELESRGITSLIIDVRNNNGGYINVAYNIADLFIGKGKVIYKLDTNKDVKVYKAQMDSTKGYKVAMLINYGSASASEVLTLAMRDSFGATIVGEKSYGKSAVQETSKTSNGSLVKYTVANWLGPNDENIGGVGIQPNIEVVQSEKYFLNPSVENDLQLSKAIEAIKK